MFRIIGIGVFVFAACSDFVPEPDLVDIDVVDADSSPADVPDIGEVTCQTDDDCVPYAQCCLDVACLQGRCMPRYVADCCVVDGPCAVDIALHSGTCETPCVRGGCVRSLNLGAAGCDRTLWELAEGDEVALVDDQPDRVTWHWSPVRPFDGRPTLRVGDVLCPTYHGGPLDADCEPLGNGGAVKSAFETAFFTVPSDAPTVVEMMLYADLGLGEVGIDRLDLLAIPDGLAATVVWTSSPASGVGQPLPMRTWTPVLVDLSRYAGRTMRLRLIFDTLDGRDNHHEGAAVARFRVKTVCEADRAVSAAGVCEVVTDTTVHPLRDALPIVSVPRAPLALHAHTCEPCTNTETCSRSDTCDVASCVGGRCSLVNEVTAECCTPEPRWSGDGSFEAPLEDWELDGAWAVRSLLSNDGVSALHFGLEDGSGLAHEGEGANGTALGGPIEVHGVTPRWRFSVLLSTEWDAAPSSDNPRGVDLLEAVVVLADDPRHPPETITVWDSRALGGTTQGAWVTVEVPLDRFAGRHVRLGWRFDTVDGEANSPGGVFIDSASVVRACPPCDPDLQSCVPQTGSAF